MTKIELYEKWWNGKLDRGLLPVIVSSRAQETTRPKYWSGDWWTFGCTQPMFANKTISPKELVDCIEYALSTLEFMGDSFPYVNMDFSGPGVVATFLGASLKVTQYSIWFYTESRPHINDLHFEYDVNNFWLCRIKEVVSEMKNHFGKQILIGMPDLGGVTDIIASAFMGTEDFMLSFYDSPQDVSRVITELCDLWHRYYSDFAALCNSGIHMSWGLLPSTPPHLHVPIRCKLYAGKGHV